MKLKEIDYWKSSELVLCATLIYFGFVLDSLDKTNPNKILFIFKRTQEFDALISNFWRKKLLVEPLAFFEAQRYLKSRIYGE